MLNYDHSSFHLNLKIDISLFIIKEKCLKKSKRQVLSLFDINRCLEEFKTQDHQGKSNSDLALVARDLLNLPKVPLKETIWQWILKEKIIKLQLEKHSEGSKKIGTVGQKTPRDTIWILKWLFSKFHQALKHHESQLPNNAWWSAKNQRITLQVSKRKSCKWSYLYGKP